VCHTSPESHTVTGNSPLEHLLIAIRVAERKDRSTTDVTLYADRFSGPVVDEHRFRLLDQHGFAFAQLETQLALTAHNLLGRDAVDALGPRAMNSMPPDTMKVLKPAGMQAIPASAGRPSR
jgi:hypothetical protein